MSHDVEYQPVGSRHPLAADRREVADAAIHVVVDNPLGRGDALPSTASSADITAVETPLDTLSAQLGFAPSQIIPVRLAIMFCTAQATSR